MARRATGIAFGLAALACVGAAWVSASAVERLSAAAVSRELSVEGLDWAEPYADGLQLVIAGTAPDEASRFRAVTVAGRAVDPARVVDAMDVTPAQEIAPPRYALEMLRNAAGVSLIGLAPEGGAAPVRRALDALEVPYTDLLETAGARAPEGWSDAVAFGLEALEALPQSKVSVEPGRVEVTAVAASDGDRRALETRLAAARPEGVSLALEIAAPRPVVAPFTLRFAIREGVPRFEACAVDDEAARDAVQAAATAAGLEGRAECRLALGAPTAEWGEAAAAAIAAVADLGEGSVTLSDTAVTLAAAEGTARTALDAAAATLEAALPPLFAVDTVLPRAPLAETDGAADGPVAEFVATRSPEGQVQLRGRVLDARQREAVTTFGAALFGSTATAAALRVGGDLPEGWPLRVMAGMEALDRVAQGAVTVRADAIDLRGVTGDPEGEAEVARLLGARLGAGGDWRIDVRYDKRLDPALNIPTPEGCVDDLNAILDAQKITFAPGAATIEAEGDSPLGALAAKLRVCDFIAVEIGGHTDSQGRESMNLDLSQQRAEAVRAALIARGIAPSQTVAQGYGEAEPIADNDTEAGRETNRRIAFTLLGERGAQASDAIEAQAQGDEG